MILKRMTCCFLLLAISQYALAEEFPQSWTQWRGAKRDGKAPEIKLATDWENQPPQLIWKTEGLGSGFASISISNGVIYTTGNLKEGQAVLAISEEDGTLLWKQLVTNSPSSTWLPGFPMHACH